MLLPITAFPNTLNAAAAAAVTSINTIRVYVYLQ